MKTTEEVVAFIRSESQLMDVEIVAHWGKLKDRSKDFLFKLEQEDEQTKVAFQLIVQAEFHGKHLTKEEKIEVENQLKELLKTVDLVALTVLPGGTLFLILSTFLKLNKYIIPTIFLPKS